MTQVNLLFFSLLTAASLNINAQAMSGYLDMSRLYGNTNAGKYFISLGLNTKTTVPLEITQKLTNPPNADQPGSEPLVCLTEFRLNAGELSFLLIDARKNESLTSKQNIILYSFYSDNTEKCTPVDEILKSPVNFMPYFNLGSFKLNYTAPKNYDALFTSISVFPYGYSVSLVISKNTDSNYVVDKLNLQMESQIKRGYKEALSFYTYAQKDDSTLSLGQGFIELK